MKLFRVYLFLKVKKIYKENKERKRKKRWNKICNLSFSFFGSHYLPILLNINYFLFEI